MIPTYVVMPVKDRVDLTTAILDQLIAQGEYAALFVFDNGSTDTTASHVRNLAGFDVQLLERPGATIYEMWNEGWLAALRCSGREEFNIAFLNNDIVIDDRFLSRLSAGLRSDEQWWAVHPCWAHIPHDRIIQTHGTGKDQGMSGWAFMLRGEKLRYGLPLVDERFRWWCGDDDVVRNIERAGGKIGCVGGVSCDHLGSASVTLDSPLHAQGWDDVEAFKAKWGSW